MGVQPRGVERSRGRESRERVWESAGEMERGRGRERGRCGGDIGETVEERGGGMEGGSFSQSYVAKGP